MSRESWPRPGCGAPYEAATPGLPVLLSRLWSAFRAWSSPPGPLGRGWRPPFPAIPEPWGVFPGIPRRRALPPQRDLVLGPRGERGVGGRRVSWQSSWSCGRSEPRPRERARVKRNFPCPFGVAQSTSKDFPGLSVLFRMLKARGNIFRMSSARAAPFPLGRTWVCRPPTASRRQSAVGTAAAPQGRPGPCCPAGWVRPGPGAPSPARPRGGRGLTRGLLGKRAGVWPPGERPEDARFLSPLRSSGQRWALRPRMQQSWSDTPQCTPKGWRRHGLVFGRGLRHLREWERSRPGMSPCWFRKFENVKRRASSSTCPLHRA